jgi:hypothetical protein
VIDRLGEHEISRFSRREILHMLGFSDRVGSLGGSP